MYSPDVRRQAIRLREQGSTVMAIHRRLGVSRAAIATWIADPVAALASFSTCFVCAGLPVQNPEAYCYLLGQYLGDGCLTMGRVPLLRIACADDYPGIAAEVDAALAAMSCNSVQRVQAVGCSEHAAYWMHWPCLFPQHGPGRKHERTIELHDWQTELVTAHPWPLLRGLIHSDGCRSLNTIRRGSPTGPKTYAYPRYFFSNNSADIIAICTEALDRVGVNWRMCRPNLVSVARRADVGVLDDHIGAKS